MLPQRLATGATGVKLARYRRGPTWALVRACAVFTQPAYSVQLCVWYIAIEGPWHLLFNVRCKCLHMNSAEGFAL